MAISKKRKAAEAKVDSAKQYSLEDALALVKEVNQTKFDASVDLHIRLGVDPRKADQAIRGTVTLPNGTGKTKKVLVLCTPDKEQEALDAGADYAGLDEYVTKISGGWTDIDVIIAMPNVMAQVGRIGRISENARELLGTLERMKPSTVKGTYMKSLNVASTMSPGITIDTKTI